MINQFNMMVSRIKIHSISIGQTMSSTEAVRVKRRRLASDT